MYELKNGALKIAFPENGGGVPEMITLLEADQTEKTLAASGDTVLNWNWKTEPFSRHAPANISRMSRTE